MHTITVKYQGGTYATNTIAGKRSSSTTCAAVAAEKLANLLYPTQAFELQALPHDPDERAAVYRFVVTPEVK